MPNIQSLLSQQALSSALHTSNDAKIEKSAKDFESLLLTNWLQQAEQSFAKVPGSDDGDDDQDAEQLQQGVAMQPLGEAMAAAGGIGIARMIAPQLHKTSR